MDSVDQASVGDRMATQQILSFNHPLYKTFAEEVAREMDEIQREMMEQRAASKKVLLTSTLSTNDTDILTNTYPEYAITTLSLNTPVHPLWNTSRELANEYLLDLTEPYASEIVHCGGSRMSNLLNKRRHVHTEFDPSDAYQSHCEYTRAVDLHRIHQDPLTVTRTTGVSVDLNEYASMLNGESYARCTTQDTCMHVSEGLCADLSVTDLSPSQLAITMIQHQSIVAHGFFIYHPSMLVSKRGEFPGTGVSYEVNQKDRQIDFTYGDGRSGVPSYKMLNWQLWLASHNFSVGIGKGKTWFALELLENRGAFMFFRLVKIPESPEGSSFRHALELDSAKDMTLIQSWRLREGFSSDPRKPSHWEPHCFLVSSRVERRVREFALTLKPENFRRDIIKKQIRVVNNRWVLRGSEVVVMPLLDPRDIESLTTAIYTRVFIERYETGTLAKAMMDKLSALARFNSMSSAERFASVVSAVTIWLYDNTLAAMSRKVKSVFDSIIEYFTQSFDAKVKFSPAPRYRTYDSIVSSWRSIFTSNSETFASGTFENLGIISPGTPGATIFAGLMESIGANHINVMRVYEVEDDMNALIESASFDEEAEETLSALAANNEMDSAAASRFITDVQLSERRSDDMQQDYRRANDRDPVASLNNLYLELFPSVAQSKLEYDSFHLSLDPQDWTVIAPYLRMPSYFGLPPSARSLYASKIVALNIPRKQTTSCEMLNAMIQRNCSAPVICNPQDEDVVIPHIWENFLREACVPDAKEKLLKYRDDPVASSEDQFKQWIVQAKGKKNALSGVRRELVDNHKSLLDQDVGQYLAILKADVKPTLSDKPVNAITAPQVVVYHEKLITAFYSSIFRVLVRRLQSLLKPSIHCNLLKDLSDIESWVSGIHPYGKKNLQYLENDFSKFDKSQSAFVFALEEYVFKQLGLNQEMLDKWMLGHVECSVRSVSLGLSLHVMYQRKSGDATTAFGNGILNMLSVFYAYKGTPVEWAVFMGDDSLVCTQRPVGADDAVQVLAEFFNLSAKYYITQDPYFASTFFLVDDQNQRVRLLPDPVKRIERLSMHISGEDPQWNERYASYQQSLAGYRDDTLARLLCKAVSSRYKVSEGLITGAASALGTIASSKEKFRSLWEENPQVLTA